MRRKSFEDFSLQKQEDRQTRPKNFIGVVCISQTYWYFGDDIFECRANFVGINRVQPNIRCSKKLLRLRGGVLESSELTIFIKS